MKFAGITLLLAAASAVEAYTRLDKSNAVRLLLTNVALRSNHSNAALHL